MRNLLLLLVIVMLAGCARNHFNVPSENFASRVRVLGVAPIMIDEDSDIKHPQKDQLIALVAEANRGNEYQLVSKLRETGNYYSISLLDGDPRPLFSALLSRREQRDDASILYNKYFWKSDELRTLMRKNNLDAIMLVVVSGLSKTETVYSNTMLSSRNGDYNSLIMTAQILDDNGAVLWEYPNFRGRILSYDPMLVLQYPDFNEAEANHLDRAELKFKSIEGIRRSLGARHKDLLRRETKESEIYYNQFKEMVSLLKNDAAKDQNGATPPAKPTAVTEKPVAVPAPNVPAEQPVVVTPAVESPATVPAPSAEPAPPQTAAPEAPAGEIVPAPGTPGQ